MQNKIYARVIDGAIIEYPVYDIHIKNRANPIEWYTPVVFLKDPEFDPQTEYLKEVLKNNGNVIVSEKIVLKQNVENILNRLFYPDGRQFDHMNPGEVVQPAVVNIGDLAPEFLQKVIDQVSKEIGDSLDAFAKTRNYDDVKSCATYVSSTNPQFKAEADKIIELRDQTYSALYNYIGQIISGQAPVPKSFSEIKAVLPELVW
jgi:hypothetical protein